MTITAIPPTMENTTMTDRIEHMTRLMEVIDDLAVFESNCGTDKLQEHFDAIRKELYAQLGSHYFDSVEGVMHGDE